MTEITEIDLSQVHVSGDETRLYNTDVPPPTDVPDDAQTRQSEPESVPTPAPSETNNAADADSALLADAQVPAEPKPEKKPDVKPVPTPVPAPKKKTVVRVNRESVSLDRTLTVSEADALRVAMTRCWVIDTKRPDIAGIRAVARLTMRQNGTVRDVWFESAARADTDPAFAYVLDTIRDAIQRCQPFKMLPASEFSKWEKIQLTFYPTQGKVM